MKHHFYRAVALMAIMFISAGCANKDERFMDVLAGDWHYSGIEQGIEEDVWLLLSADGTFDMYQKIGEGAYWHSAGTWAADSQSKVLSGVYEDRTPWRYDYSWSVTGDSMTLTAVQADTWSVTYSREAFPESVRDKSLELTKSSGETPVLFL